ncbi:MAG: class I SAM-dependent methyltransferase [Candidatus Hodarchaeales archaeon]|jgi:SAM-dependent methyltransferase
MNNRQSLKKTTGKETEKYWSTRFYNQIPDFIFGDRILEIGARDGTPQLESRHREKFLNAEYIGLDLIKWTDSPPLNIQIKSIFDFEVEPESFDLIISIAVFEHISFESWDKLFDICKNLTKPGGYIVLIVPDNQLLGEYVNSQDYKVGLAQLKEYGSDANIHRVFSITPSVFRYFLPGCRTYRKRFPIKLKNPGDSNWWITIRFLKRLLTFHPYVWNGLLRKKNNLQVVWKKPMDDSY